MRPQNHVYISYLKVNDMANKIVDYAIFVRNPSGPREKKYWEIPSKLHTTVRNHWRKHLTTPLTPAACMHCQALYIFT